MTYQSQYNNNNNLMNNNQIGVSGPGFASRGKGSHIKRLSVAPPPKISTIDETQAANHCSTPRTARGHLLAGLRTAPKSATVAPQSYGLDKSKFAPQQSNRRVPQTATSAYFPGQGQFNPLRSQSHQVPEQVLAPPAIDFGQVNTGGMDPNIYEELVATNNYLAQQQRALQQQLLNVQLQAQMGGLNLSNQMYGAGVQNAGSPMNMYGQQFQQHAQPVVQAVPGNPGVFAVYNPMTGQSSYVFDNNAQHEVVPPVTTGSPFEMNQRRSPPVNSPAQRSVSPPKQSVSPPVDHEPLPPPSANAFRRGHRKGVSSVNVKAATEWTRGSGPKTAGIPPTPMTGQFGPGQARAGEHPVRQPRNPPHLSELQEKPTSKHEGSKNFATRQRRRAVHDLVKAGRERMSDRNSNSDSGTPGSEAEFNFSVSSDDNDVFGRSGNLSSKPSSGSLAAIGSERKEKSRERNSVGSNASYESKGMSSDEGFGNEVDSGRRKTPILVLSSAEKQHKTIAF